MAARTITAAALALAALAWAQPAAACDPPENAAEAAERDRATNQAILKALLDRRAEVLRSQGGAEGKAAALEFLDARIAQVRRRLSP